MPLLDTMIEITINIDTKEIQELEKNGSKLIDFLITNQANTTTIGSELISEKMKEEAARKQKEAADKKAKDALVTEHQLLAEVIRNSIDQASVIQTMKEKKSSLKRNMITSLMNNKKWLKEHKIPKPLPKDDSVFRMKNEQFTVEVINHLKHRLQSVAKGDEPYIEINIIPGKDIVYASWRNNILETITDGKKYDKAKRTAQIDKIMHETAIMWKTALPYPESFAVQIGFPIIIIRSIAANYILHTEGL
jgi:hypothetical protein